MFAIAHGGAIGLSAPSRRPSVSREPEKKGGEPEMSGIDHADELLARIYAYMVRAANDPEIISRAPREMGAIVIAWRILSVMVPGLLPFDAEQFRRYLVAKGAKKTAGVIALAPSRLAGSSEPAMPPAHATESELAAYQQSLAKYSRMQEMMAKIMSNSLEMRRKALVDNLR